MEIDFSVGQPTMNELALQLVIILGGPLGVSLIILFILRFLRIPIFLIRLVAVIVFLFGVYQMFMIMY